VLLSGSTDSNFLLAWRREHADLSKRTTTRSAIRRASWSLGVRDPVASVAMRATFIVDPTTRSSTFRSIINVGRNPSEILRILDGLQTDELCPCNRAVGGNTL
jgi:peroxiredoxin (alkyl hydroperoxide reductase subunit C)